jgi:hypothetical protein
VTVDEVWFGNRTHWTRTLVINIYSNSTSHTLQFTTARTESSQSAVSSSVLWYRLPTAGVPLPFGSRTVTVLQPQQLFTHSKLNWKSTSIVIYNNLNSHLLELYPTTDWNSSVQELNWLLLLMLRLTVSRPICLGFGANDQITFFLSFLSSDYCLIIEGRRSFWRENGSVDCNSITHLS